jgi:ParB-like chromosome segregation protein Spo0J
VVARLADVFVDRAVPEDPAFRELLANIHMFGQLIPVDVVPSGQGYRVIDGARRVLALRRLGAQCVEVRVLEARL